LGTISYTVYLLHQGINFLYHYAIFGRTAAIVDFASAAVTCLSAATVVGMASISWQIMEKPLIRRAHRLTEDETEPLAAEPWDAGIGFREPDGCAGPFGRTAV